MREVVLVTETEYGKGESVFGMTERFDVRPCEADEEVLASAVTRYGCRAVVVGVAPYRGPLYEALGKTGGADGALLARFGVGHDSVDKARARRHGVVVTNTPGTLDQSVAELTIGLLLGLARHVAQGHLSVTAGRFQAVTGVELAGRTLGLVGFGPIARRVATIAGRGLGMRVLACGRRDAATLAADEQRPLEAILAKCAAAAYTDDVDTVLAQADAISLHIPGSAERFINAARLEKIKPGAMLVNTARGSVIDEAALYDALASGRLAGAALDVYAREPYEPIDPDHDLRTLPNVLLTPHCGSNTTACNERMALAVLRNLEAFFDRRFDGLDRVDTG